MVLSQQRRHAISVPDVHDRGAGIDRVGFGER